MKRLAIGGAVFLLGLVFVGSAGAGASTEEQGSTAGESAQSASSAETTGTGANQTGPYDGTSDGTPSGNGNDGGEAVGQPCAGCVGEADNMNPAGQLPNGIDPNQGYECDANHGIGRTNPAHTGCTPETTKFTSRVLGETFTRSALVPGASGVEGVEAASLARTGGGRGLAALAWTGLILILTGALLLGVQRSPATVVTAAVATATV